MSELDGRRLHFIAIGGAGMSGLALICRRLGATVSGSDKVESSYLARLRAAGLDPEVGHAAENVPADAEVIVSTAVPDDNVELALARQRGQRVRHRGELLAELCGRGRLVAVAGAHGKTTTAGMLTAALRGAGADPRFLLGGELPGAGSDGGAANAGWGGSEWIVAEADESDGSFLRLRPEVAVLTNVELDHHSHWRGEAELLDAFARFLEPAAGVVAPLDRRLDRALGSTGSALRFALEGERHSERADLLARAIEPVAGGIRFELAGAPGGPRDVELAVPGRHNVANALAAIGALVLAGAADGLPELDRMLAALAGFGGMARRLERKGERGGAVVYDDYAHHPTEVAASLAALREMPHRRLIAVFQPHLYSRTKALAARFGRALTLADEVAVLDVYPAREQPTGELAGVSGLRVARAAADAAPGKRVLWAERVERAAELLAPELGDGDLVVTIGAGDVWRVAELLVGGARSG